MFNKNSHTHSCAANTVNTVSAVNTASKAARRFIYGLGRLTCLLISLLISVSLAISVNATEIVTWKDKNGTVHFGDRIPPGKEKTAEKIKIQHAPVNTPEKDVLKKESDYWYRQKLANQEKQKAKKAKQNQDRSESNTSPTTIEDKKRFCRDTFSYNVKLRTECFNEIQK